jgi:hypothetical protein
MSNSPERDGSGPSRRRILQILGVGGVGIAVGLPARWTRPVVNPSSFLHTPQHRR